MERSTDSLSSELTTRVDSVGETPTDAAETAALPISTESFRLKSLRDSQTTEMRIRCKA